MTRGRRISLTDPRLVTDARRQWAPPLVRLILGLTNVPHYLRLTRVPAS